MRPEDQPSLIPGQTSHSLVGEEIHEAWHVLHAKACSLWTPKVTKATGVTAEMRN